LHDDPFPADSENLEMLSLDYARDRTQVYLDDHPSPGHDPMTFCILGMVTGPIWRIYTGNRNGVYFANKKIPGADIATFSLLGDRRHDYAHDRDSVYFRGKKVPGAAPDTFEVPAYDPEK
jgi:hypothetical protein